MTMKRTLTLASALLLPLALLGACDQSTLAPLPSSSTPAALSAGGQTRIAVCHSTGSEENPYVLITVANPAFSAHEAHGDAGPGEAVPGMEG